MKTFILPLLVAVALVAGCKDNQEKPTQPAQPAQPTQSAPQNQPTPPATPTQPNSGPGTTQGQ